VNEKFIQHEGSYSGSKLLCCFAAFLANDENALAFIVDKQFYV